MLFLSHSGLCCSYLMLFLLPCPSYLILAYFLISYLLIFTSNHSVFMLIWLMQLLSMFYIMLACFLITFLSMLFLYINCLFCSYLILAFVALLSFLAILSKSYRCSTRLERLARNKHSSWLRKLVNYGRKKFYNIGPRTNPQAYYEHSWISVVKSLITSVPGRTSRRLSSTTSSPASTRSETRSSSASLSSQATRTSSENCSKKLTISFLPGKKIMFKKMF